jgi:shikimate kinase
MAQPGAPERLRAAGTVIYLRARVDTLAQRVGGGATRPLLAGLDAAGRRAKLAELLGAREPAYRQAHITVDTDRYSLRRVAREIAALLGEAAR